MLEGNDLCDAMCRPGGGTSCKRTGCKHQRKEKFPVKSCLELNQPWNYQQRTVDLSTTLHIRSETYKLSIVQGAERWIVCTPLGVNVFSPCGGGLEMPASRKRRRKGNPVPGGKTRPPSS
jgi:hypothetical protein